MKSTKINIERFIFPYLYSNMYIIAEYEKAVVIDPHYSEDANKYLYQHNIKEIIIILTHEHFDHTSGVNWLKENFKTTLVCQQEALNSKYQKYCNRPTLIYLKLLDEGKIEEAEDVKEKYKPYTYHAEIIFKEYYDIEWQNHIIHIESIPGHSPASCMIVFDRKEVFTGDSLIPNIATIVRWPWSNEKIYKEVTLEKLKEIPNECMIYPGHGKPISKRDLKYSNGVFLTNVSKG